MLQRCFSRFSVLHYSIWIMTFKHKLEWNLKQRKQGHCLKIMLWITFMEVKPERVLQFCDIKQCFTSFFKLYLSPKFTSVLFIFYTFLYLNNYRCDSSIFMLHFEGLIKNKQYRERQLSLANISTKTQIKIH